MRLGASVLFFLSLSESRSESIHHAQLPDLTGLKTQVNAKVLSRLPPHHVNPGHGKSEGCSASHPLTAVAVTLPLSPPLSDPGSGLTGCTRFRLTPCTPSMQMGTSGLEDTSSCKAWQKLTLAEVSLHLPLY